MEIARTLLVALGIAAVALLLAIPLRHQIDELHRFVQRTPKWQRVILGVFLAVAVAFGGGKTNQTDNAAGGTTNAPTMMALSDSSPMVASQLDENAAMVRNINLRGAWDDTFRLAFDADWVFPYGTSHLVAVQLDTQGKVRPWWNATNAIASLGVPLAIVPGLTAFACERTTNNSYLVSWTNGAANRDTNTLVSAAIELFRNGDTRVTTNDVVRFTPREIPFPHDGFGQDADWVRANFKSLRQLAPALTNAEEILAVGYPNWVDDCIGIDLTNGLYKFTATFTSAPPEATQLTVGEWTVCVTNAGDYVFVLEKGVEYAFNTSPYDASAEFSMQDDIAPDAEVVYPAFSIFNSPFSILSSWWGGDGEWSVDGGWRWIDAPWIGWAGYCLWMPMLRGSPDVTHLGPDDFPMTFTAILTDYSGRAPVAYEWAADTSDVSFSDPNAQTTLVSCASFPTWESLLMSVRADLCGYSLYSYLHVLHGTNGFPLASFALSAPETVFLNDDDRTSRWYRVSLVFSCPVETNAVFSLTHNGDSGLRFAEGPDGSCPLSWTQIQNGVSNLEQYRSLEFYIACSNIAEGTFTATCTLPSGAVMTSIRDYKVIEPLRKLVCTDSAPDGGIVNPSRLVYGTNAWLHVDQNGGFNLGDVVWRVVSGPGEFVSADRNWACVRATDTTGVVVVEAAFGSDSLVQPRFVLPVVEKRRIPVRVYYVKDSQGGRPDRLSLFADDLQLANQIFSQVGVEFYHAGSAQSIADASYSDLPEHEVVVRAGGTRRSIPGISGKAVSLFNLLPLTDEELRVVYVSKIIQGTSHAFSVCDNRVIVMGEKGTEVVLAHELGHLLGMEDIYFARKDDPSVLMPGFDDVVYDQVFAGRECDWGVDDGRAFYEISDSHGALIGQLLMCGFDDIGSGDIPDGSVCGYPPEPRNAFQKPYIEVGADTVRRNLR